MLIKNTLATPPEGILEVQAEWRAQLMEQYKLYVEMADRNSQRRVAASTYFLSMNSALLAATGYLTSTQAIGYVWLLASAGIILSFLWRALVASYRALSEAKFNVINSVERLLPLSLYEFEWDLLKKGQQYQQPTPLSTIERHVPLVFASLHFLILLRAAPWCYLFYFRAPPWPGCT